MTTRRRVFVVGTTVVIVLAATVTVMLVAIRPEGSAVPPLPLQSGQKTIVLILTDDQRWDELSGMPNVKSELAAHGITFTNAFVDDPLCCPSRASILTSRYPHSTGVWANRGPLGGFKVFHDRSTIATWLRATGYHTGLFGKYLNEYEGTPYVPPGWERWVAFDGSVNRKNLYYRYNLNIDGKVQSFDKSPSDYSTDVVANHAISFIRQTAGPMFVYFAPYAPHLPAVPAFRDVNAFADLPPLRPPSFGEPDISDKPKWVHALKPTNEKIAARIDKRRRHTYASLLAVDRAVAGIVAALKDTGRLANALIVFTSDNGFLWGEHRLIDKIAPYEESIRVPFIVRDDQRIRSPGTDRHMIMNIDLAPTFAAFAGVQAPGAVGLNFLPLLDGTRTRWRKDFLVESAQGFHVPAYCAVRTERYVYVTYMTGARELYDLTNDPYELNNLAQDPSMGKVRSRLGARLHALCSKPPPGFASPP